MTFVHLVIIISSVHHMDLYRLKDGADLSILGIPEVFETGTYLNTATADVYVYECNLLLLCVAYCTSSHITH